MSRRCIKVLFVTSELFPLIKTGGLADVSASLPAALQAENIDVRILLPGYTKVLAHLPRTRKIAFISNPSSYFPDCVLRSARLAQSDVPIYLLDCPTLYDHADGPYQDRNSKDLPYNHLRFGYLGYIGALLAGPNSPLTWQPDIIHCNDWQSGLAPAYLKFQSGATAKSVATIHNLAFQGIFPPDSLAWLNLPPQSFQMNGVEYYGNLSFLKAALYYADRITTVSPTYAQEIQHEPLGMGLQGLLASRKSDLTGILNGIDEHEWDPATDSHLAAHYSRADLSNKAANKLALQKRMGLDLDASAPLLGIVSRLTHQKGIDMILPNISQIMSRNCHLAVLGSGEAAHETALLQFAQQFPGKIAVKIGFDESLSHLITAGIDLFLMPSRFEPCGLNQMYSQRYGSPPIVTPTGGLADTVIDCNDVTLSNATASGIVLTESTSAGLLNAIDRALTYYRKPRVWRQLQTIGMARDFSWKTSARRYAELYHSLLPLN